MSDQQEYRDETARTGLIISTSRDAAFVRTYPFAASGMGAPVMLPISKLLAMIDTTAPDAMRAYLRERSDLMDSPDESRSTLEDMLPADLAAEAARYRIDAVPEADSPEDIDERVRPTPAAAERLALLETVRALYPGTTTKVHREVVEWIIGDEPVRIQDYSMAGEPIGPRTSQQLHESEED